MILKLARISYDAVVAYAAEELKRCLEIMDPSVQVLTLTYPAWREDVKDALWIGMDPALPVSLPEVEDPFPPSEPDYGYWEERGWHGKRRPWDGA